MDEDRKVKLEFGFLLVALLAPAGYLIIAWLLGLLER
jgi:hypothetical protein